MGLITCKQKIQYENKAEARKAARKLRRLYAGRYHSYKCKNCGKYHVGHDRPENRRRKTRAMN